MNEDTIRSYAKLMKELNLSGLEISENNTSIKLEMKQSGAISYQELTPVQGQTESVRPNTAGLDEITSPMIGVFYSAPAENAEPFVKKGDRIKKGDTLCIIEAMKLMNEVVAERDGIIEEICVKNAETVDYGTVLFLIGD